MSVFRVARPEPFPTLDREHWVLEASAGTGKTFTLAHLVVELVLEAGIPLEQILVVTFTEAAALELRRRIRETLQELRDLRKDACEPGKPAWTIDDEARKRLDAALQAFDRATIGTIHGFCQKTLRESAFEAGRMFRQERVKEEELFAEAFRDALRTTHAATSSDRAFLLEALDRLGSPEELQTLLREAWKARAELVPGDTASASLEAIRTFPVGLLEDLESLCAAVDGKSRRHVVQRLESLKAALEAVLAAPTLRAWSGLVALDLWTSDAVWAKALWSGVGSLGPVRQALEMLRPLLPTVESLIVHRLLPPVRQTLEARKEAEGLFDFNDMIDQVHVALARPGLVPRLRTRYRAALLDEFQDTDGRQWEIFRQVFHTPGHRLYLIGDPKQAIYDFRGGDLPTYLAAKDALRAAGGGFFNLDRNFRSSPALIARVNDLLDPGGEGFFTGDNRYDDPVSAGRPGIRLHRGGIEASPLRLFRVPVDATIGVLRSHIAAGIARAFRALVDDPPTLDDGEPGKPERPLHAGDLMVLVHTSKEAQTAAAALRDAGLPVSFFKLDGLFQSLEALELRDLLRGVLDPDDPDARGRALLTRFFGFGLAQVEACRDLPAGHPVLERLEGWRDLARARRWPRLFNALLDESGVTARLLVLESGDRALTNLHHLLEHLRAEALASHLDLEDLLARLEDWIRDRHWPEAEDADVQRAEGEAEAVRILTIHKAKGLEAPVVALFGGYAENPNRGKVRRFHDAGRRAAFLGAPPAGLKEAMAQEAREEDQRLLYVALTRAKVQVLLPVFEPGEPRKVSGRSSFEADATPKGRHGILNRRLRSLLADEATASVWSPFLEPLPAPLPPSDPAAARDPGPFPEPPPSPRPDLAGLARAGRPLQLLSFTSLSKAFQASAHGPSREEEARADEVEVPRALREDGGLPPGAATGTALHELLEALPPGSTVGMGPEAWSQAWAARARLHLGRQGLDPGLAPQALDLAWRALTTPLRLPGGPTLRLDDTAPRLRELAFQMPFPGQPDGLEGSLDLVFEAEDRLYVLDWKTNTLPEGDYGPAAVAAAVEAHYDLQVRIYTLAALAFAGIDSREAFGTRFGGVVYVFLRGLPEGGVWTTRPSWDEVQAWRRALADMPLEDLALARLERGMHG